MSDDYEPLICPECDSRRIAVTRDSPPRGRCIEDNCGCLFEIPTIAGSGTPHTKSVPPETKTPKKKRESAPGTRHRREKDEVEVKPATPLKPADFGLTTATVNDLMHGGPKAVIAAQQTAKQLSDRFGEQWEQAWLLKTSWLSDIEENGEPRPNNGNSKTEQIVPNRACERVRYALMWRPRFLAAVALTRSLMIGCKVAHVSINTVKRHREADPEFDAQVIAAQAHATELLHDRCFGQALEGVLEPVFWQGIEVGHIRKFPERLQIEMLRAYHADRFKTPGSGNVTVNANQQNNTLIVVSPAVQDKLIAMRQAGLERMAAQRAEIAAVKG